ncbi:probable arginine--tRNA ligase, mitochondrial [Diachasma alloeum]|uniref:probable arginine--tRNA ligase, mitochondrial n=1 Tax=Diachasma alloeum TaxID=454923 RepID=UPI0007384E4C|nr:probable arginine--tRNA ligase, mitochondrial [Diachasma alloeum]
MSSRIRSLLQKKILQSTGLPDLPISQHLSLKLDKTTNAFAYEFPLRTPSYDIRGHSDLLTSLQIEDDLFKTVSLTKRKNHEFLSISMNRESFVKQTLECNRRQVVPPGVAEANKKILVEFSSPNIAKPFHVGHLRSTIIGNYVSNLNKYLNNRVLKLNYLGDWGTQLGFILLGMDLLDIPAEKMRDDPMRQLYEAYVHANKLSESDPGVLDKARDIFQRLEKGDAAGLSRWEMLKNLTVKELQKTYERLGVQFDEYHWESSYNFSKITGVIDHMGQLELLRVDEQGRKVVEINEKRNLPIIKSDGSTLYITRDIAAAIDRAGRGEFDAMYYVVESGQHDHLNNLFTILGRMGYSWASKLQHLKFGRISGMSTRRGTAVFLEDFLDEARDAMREQQRQTATTKVDLDSEEGSSDVLGISAVVVHDLKQRRTKDYKFSWDVALDIKGETGVKLQYTHCRLFGIEENSGATLPSECNPQLLTEPIINDLVTAISQFDEAVVLSYQTLESCYLAKYLFNLSHTVNKTIQEIRVKGESSDVAAQRLLLYHSSRNVLNTGMKLLGLTPLNKM